MKRKRVTVMSPKLEKVLGGLVGVCSGEDWFCFDMLRRLVEMPDARYYWVEGSTHQWPDGSGTQVYVRLIERESGARWSEFRHRRRFRGMYLEVDRLVEKLGAESNGDAVAIYFRLWYGD